MPEKVVELNPLKGPEMFLDRLFGQYSGFVYCPTTTAGDASDSESHFFKWPSQRRDIVAHVRKMRSRRDIYFSPTLFRNPELNSDYVCGTKFVWAEFNGETPADDLKGLPAPSIKVLTSKPGHEVWLWELDSFNSNLKEVRDILSRIAYHLDADLSTWHHEDVLRLPGTVNHRAGVEARIIESNASKFSIERFKILPEITKPEEEPEEGPAPSLTTILMRHPFKEETIAFFQKRDPLAGKPEEEKTRSALHKAYTRLAFDLAEAGLSNREMLILLTNADGRWKLWADRNPEQQRRKLKGLVDLVRKHISTRIRSIIEQEDDYDSITWNYWDFLEQEFEFDWLVKDLIEKNSFALIVADSETGKTRLTLSLSIHLAMGRKFLIWEPIKPLKIVYASLEQGRGGLQMTVNSLSIDSLNITDEEKALLGENFLLFAKGSSIHLDKPQGQSRFTKYIENHAPDIIIIDTLGVAIQDDIENAKIINTTFEYINATLREKLGIAVCFIHHNKKHGDGKAKKDDMFGSMYIRAQASSVIGLTRIGSRKTMTLSIDNGKNRLALPFDTFTCMAPKDSAHYEISGYSAISAPNSGISSGGFETEYEDIINDLDEDFD